MQRNCQSFLLFAALTVFLVLTSSSSPVSSTTPPSSSNDLSFQDARLRFYSLLAVNYTYIGLYRVFRNFTADSTNPTFVYECNISVTDGYNLFGANSNADLDACFNLTGVPEDSGSGSDGEAGGRTDENRITSPAQLNKVMEHLSDWNSDYQSGRDQAVSSIARLFVQIGDQEAASLPDPARLGAYFDVYQSGIPTLIEFRAGAQEEYVTHLQMLTLVNISGIDEVREQNIAIWNDRQDKWIGERRPQGQYHFDLTIFRGTKDELEKRTDISGVNAPDHCIRTGTPDKSNIENKPLCIQTFRIGVTRMSNSGGDKTVSFSHFDPRDYRVYRIIDLSTNREVHNITGLVEEGVYLTLEQHMGRINLAINISDNLDDENSFFAQYSDEEGFPTIYSWRNPFHNWVEGVRNKQYNTIMTWRITDYKEGPLDSPGPHALAIAAVVLIVIGIIIIIAVGVVKLYKKVVEDGKYGNREQNQVVRSIEGGNGPVQANDIDIGGRRRKNKNNNASTSSRETKYAEAGDTRNDVDDLPTVERVNGGDFSDDDFEMHNTSAV